VSDPGDSAGFGVNARASAGGRVGEALEQFHEPDCGLREGRVERAVGGAGRTQVASKEYGVRVEVDLGGGAPPLGPLQLADLAIEPVQLLGARMHGLADRRKP
jgi:hypothetical protein